MKPHPITATRQLIHNAVRGILYELIPETYTIELQITPDAMLYVDVSAEEYPDGTTGIEITGVDIYKDSLRRECTLPNIAEAVGRELDSFVTRNR